MCCILQTHRQARAQVCWRNIYFGCEKWDFNFFVRWKIKIRSWDFAWFKSQKSDHAYYFDFFVWCCVDEYVYTWANLDYNECDAGKAPALRHPSHPIDFNFTHFEIECRDINSEYRGMCISPGVCAAQFVLSSTKQHIFAFRLSYISNCHTCVRKGTPRPTTKEWSNKIHFPCTSRFEQIALGRGINSAVCARIRVVERAIAVHRIAR